MTDQAGTIADHTRADGVVVEHEVVFNARGQLLSRTRGDQGLSWEYDQDGYRVAFTDANGTTTTYKRDAAGRITAVANPRLGKAVFAYNQAGQLASSRVGEGVGALVQEWVYRNGALSEHTRTTVGAEADAATTLIGRDEDGRTASITTNTDHTSYAHDDAGQLVAAQVKDLATGTTTLSSWVFDQGGRLLAETRPDGSQIAYAYNQAGQLTTKQTRSTGQGSNAGAGGTVRFAYDALGRRSRVIGEDGAWEQYTWGPLGYLAEHSTHTPEGESTSEQVLWVDALGELAGVNGENVWWDTAAGMPSLVGVGQEQVLTLPGGLTGVGESWLSPGWRGTRATDTADPWALIGALTIPNPTGTGGPAGTADAASTASITGTVGAGLQLSATGSLAIAGLEWLGARAYDPSTRAFLSTDPLAPTLGAGWDGNPYAYAGNNPVAFSDPNGLKPLTDKELKAYDASSRGAVQAVGKWLGENWEYFAGGAMVIAGGVLIATGVGGPAGMALIGAGADTIIQKATTGEVNWGQVAFTGAVGLVAGPLASRVGSVVSGAASRVGSVVTSRVLPALGRTGSAIASGASRVASAASSAATRLGSMVANGASRVGSAVTSAASRMGATASNAASSVVNGVSSYASQLSGQQMLRGAVSNGIGGGVSNTGMYFITTPQDEWSFRGAGAAAAGGAVSGGLSSLSGLAKPLDGLGASVVKNTVAGGSSVLGGFVDNGIAGEEYSAGEMIFDGLAGVASSKFPGAEEIGGANASWGSHIGAAYAGGHVSAITESVKFVGEFVGEQVGAPW